MADELERLAILVEANTRAAERAMRDYQSKTQKSIEGIDKDIEQLNNNFDQAAKKTKAAADEAAAAAPATNALKEGTTNLALATAVAAAKVSLFAISVGLWPGRIGRAIRALQALRLSAFVVVGAIGSAIAVSLKAVPAFAKWEKQMLTVEQVVRATGGAAGRTAQDIDRLEESISKTTLATGDQVKDAAAQLLTFRSVSEDVFDRALKASQDLAAVGFGTVSSSAVQLGKALEDPEKGLAALRRVGVSFTASQREMIKNFLETGRAAEAQRAILRAIEQQVGGAGAAQAGGLAGAFHLLSEETGDWFEIIGGKVARLISLNSLLRGLASAVGAVNDALDTADDTALDAAERRLAALKQQRDQLALTGPRPELEAEISQVQSLIDEYKRFDRILENQKHERARRAQEQISRSAFEGEVTSLNKQAEALKRSELAQQQFEAVRRASVPTDSAEADRIRELVRQNYEYVKAKEAAADAAKTAEKDREAATQRIRDTVSALEFEGEQLRRNATEQEIYNQLKSAEVSRNTEAGQKIAELVQRNQRLSESQEALNVQMQFFGDLATGALSSIIVHGEDAADVMRRLVSVIADAALQATLLGQGPLAEAFGTAAKGGAAGNVGGLVGKLFGGFRAAGGPVTPNKSFLVGERGPEMFIPKTAGQIMPMGKTGGGGGIVLNQSNSFQSGITPTDRAWFEARIADNNRVLRRTIVEDLRAGIRADANFLRV